MPRSSFALQGVTLAWNPSPDPVAGYRIYYGASSGSYSNVVSYGDVTNGAVTDLIEGTTYFFTVKAYDALGESPPSNEATYSVPITGGTQPPVISLISDQITYQNTATPPIPFTIGDAETAASNLTITATSSNTVLVQATDIIFGGSGSNRTVTLTPIAQQIGQTDIKITVNDGDATTSTTFRLTVLAPLPKPDPVQYVPATAAFSGLFYEPDQVRQKSAGFVSVMVASRGTYSGRLQLGAARLSFHGRLDAQGHVLNTILRRNEPGLQVEFQIGADQIFGHVTDGTWISTLVGNRTVFNSKTNPAPYAGSYTLVLPGTNDIPSLPAGDGFGTVRVTAAGAARFAGALADGTKVSQSAAISGHGLWPLYASLYSGKGSLTSWIAFTNRANDDLDGPLSWIKLADSKARYYAGGFDEQLDLIGSTYHRPVSGSAILNFVNGFVQFSGGNLVSDFTNSTALGPGTHITNLSSNRLTLSFSPASGVFGGRATDPASNNSFAFKGAVLQKMNAGYGFLLGTDQSSQVIIAP